MTPTIRAACAVGLVMFAVVPAIVGYAQVPSKPVTAARSPSRRDPACEATPRPSAVTVIFGRREVFFT